MIFTRIGTVLAHFVFWLSLVRLFTALSIAFFSASMESNRLMSRHYLRTDSSGAALTNELYLMIFLAVALGVLCEISKKSGKSVDSAPH